MTSFCVEKNPVTIHVLGMDSRPLAYKPTSESLH